MTREYIELSFGLLPALRGFWEKRWSAQHKGSPQGKQLEANNWPVETDPL